MFFQIVLFVDLIRMIAKVTSLLFAHLADLRLEEELEEDQIAMC